MGIWKFGIPKIRNSRSPILQKSGPLGIRHSPKQNFEHLDFWNLESSNIWTCIILEIGNFQPGYSDVVEISDVYFQPGYMSGRGPRSVHEEKC